MTIAAIVMKYRPDRWEDTSLRQAKKPPPHNDTVLTKSGWD